MQCIFTQLLCFMKPLLECMSGLSSPHRQSSDWLPVHLQLVTGRWSPPHRHQLHSKPRTGKEASPPAVSAATTKASTFFIIIFLWFYSPEVLHRRNSVEITKALKFLWNLDLLVTQRIDKLVFLIGSLLV